MTSYGGIIRIRLRVEVRLLPLSLPTQAPLYLLCRYYTSKHLKRQEGFTKRLQKNDESVSIVIGKNKFGKGIRETVRET